MPNNQKQSIVHLMVDLETLSTAPNAKILSVGIIPFFLYAVEGKFSEYKSRSEIKKTEPKLKELYKVLSLKDQNLRHESESTSLWWKNQSAEAREVLEQSSEKPNSVRQDAFDILSYLSNLQLALENTTLIYWGNGAGFDNVILKGLLEEYVNLTSYKLNKLWSYKHDVCYRTQLNNYRHNLKSNQPSSKEASKLIYHNALDDCKYQIRQIEKAMGPERLCQLSQNFISS